MRPARWKLTVAAAILTAAFWSAAPGGAVQLDLPGDPALGLDLFVKKGCAKCHAIQGEGGTAGPDLAKVQLGHSFLGLAGIMWNHLPKMAEQFGRLQVARPTLTEQEASQIMALLYSLSFMDRRPDPARGREMFDAKGCRRCHAVRGRGGSVGPPLDRFGGKVSPAFLAAAFWNKGFKMARSAREAGVKWPRFEGDELANISAYLRVEAVSGDRERVYLKPGSPRTGEALFQSKGCAQCHTVNGKGGTIGPNLSRRDLKRSLTQIMGVIWNKGPDMWEEVANRKLDVPLTPQETVDLLSYLYFIQYTDPPGDPRAGRKFFTEKDCGICHRSASTGLGIGPDLAMKKLLKPTRIVADMWNHGPKMDEKAREMGIVWPKITAREMADLIAYIKEIQVRRQPAKQ